MPTFRALVVGVLCSAAASAQQVEPVIARPPTLPKGAVDLTLHGTYTNWGTSFFAGGGGPTSLAGETLAWGVDYGATDQVQLGLAMALPINPGASFGSILGDTMVRVGKDSALRVDAGYERIGFNGDNTSLVSHTDRYFGGLGAQIKVPLSPAVALVSGRSDAVHFAHFNNIGDNGTGLYIGGSGLTELSSDFFVFSGGSN